MLRKLAGAIKEGKKNRLHQANYHKMVLPYRGAFAHNEAMRMLVMGAGAIGSVLGGLMAAAGHRVTLAGRPAHIMAIRDRGLRITGIWGDHVIKEIRAATTLEGMKPGDFDLIVIAVKSYDTIQAVQAAAGVADDNTLVCSYQNGLGNVEVIAATVGWARTVGARAIYGVWMPEPGIVDVTVIAAPTALGVYAPEAPETRVRRIAEAMNAAGVPTVYSSAIRTVQWAKVAYNCALNPLSALLDVPYGRLLETGYTRSIMREVVQELYAVGRALGVPLDPATPEAYERALFEKLIPPTAAHYASMREDLRRGRRTEIDALNGAIARLGESCGAPCPTNALLTRLVHAREHALGVPA